ncbi:MAG: hypothetical protein ACYC7D_03185 [Nitrososphaerales archaeon]
MELLKLMGVVNEGVGPVAAYEIVDDEDKAKRNSSADATHNILQDFPEYLRKLFTNRNELVLAVFTLKEDKPIQHVTKARI